MNRLQRWLREDFRVEHSEKLQWEQEAATYATREKKLRAREAAWRSLAEETVTVDMDEEDDGHVYYVNGDALAKVQAKARALLGG